MKIIKALLTVGMCIGFCMICGADNPKAPTQQIILSGTAGFVFMLTCGWVLVEILRKEGNETCQKEK